MNIELASILRACFRASSPAEKRYNLKWINCVILEGYKYLYGYGRKKKKSLWVSKIKPMVEILKDREFEHDFEIIETRIIEFGKNNITNKEYRDLSFHYDLEPLSVYNMLMELGEEEEAQRMISFFMGLLQEISLFVSKYLKDYEIHVNVEPKSISKYEFAFTDLDIFQNSKDNLYSTLKEAIQGHSQRLDEFFHLQKLPDWIIQEFKNIDSETIAPIHKCIEIVKVAIQLTYLYIDLASASCAFISSEYTIEKQLSLKQINTIIYEGYDKLYGLSDDSEDSFWKKYVSPIALENKDETIFDNFNFVEQELQTFKLQVKTFERQRQLSVHLDKGIVRVYSMLHNLNPIVELHKALQLLNILPKILDFLTKCFYLIQANHEKKMAPTYETIDNIINLIKNVPDTQQKENLIKILESIKTGDFLTTYKTIRAKNPSGNFNF